MLSENGPDEAGAVESRLELDHVRDETRLSTEHGPLIHVFLVAARDEGKSLKEGLAVVAIALSEELIGSGIEQAEHAVLDSAELTDRSLRGRLDDVTGLRHTDLRESEAGLSLNLLNEGLLLHVPEGDASSLLTGSGGSTGAMDISFDILWGLDLDDQVDVGNVETARCNIGRNEHLELLLLESLESDLTLSLSNIAMHDLEILLDLVGEDQLVGLCLGLTEDNSLAETTVDNENISESLHPVVVRAVDGNVFNVLLRLVLKILCKINSLPVRSQIGIGKVLNPWRSGGREQKELRHLGALLLNCSEDLVDVLLEAHVQHLVRLVEDNSLDLCESQVATVDMVEHATSGANENVDTASQLIHLLGDRGTTINRNDIEFVFEVLELNQSPADLESELSRRRQNDSLNVTRAEQLQLAESFDQGQTEAEGFTRAGQVAHDQILFIVHIVEGLVLHGEKLRNALLSELDNGLAGDLREVGKFSRVGDRSLNNILLHNSRVSAAYKLNVVLRSALRHHINGSFKII